MSLSTTSSSYNWQFHLTKFYLFNLDETHFHLLQGDRFQLLESRISFDFSCLLLLINFENNDFVKNSGSIKNIHNNHHHHSEISISSWKICFSKHACPAWYVSFWFIATNDEVTISFSLIMSRIDKHYTVVNEANHSDILLPRILEYPCLLILFWSQSSSIRNSMMLASTISLFRINKNNLICKISILN